MNNNFTKEDKAHVKELYEAGKVAEARAFIAEKWEAENKTKPKRWFNWRRFLYRWFGWLEKRKLRREADRRLREFTNKT